MDTREVRCVNAVCGAMNRIPICYPFTHIPQRGKCKTRLPEKITIRAGRFKNRWRSQIAITIYLSIFGGVALVGFFAERKPPRILLPPLSEIPAPDLCADRPQPRQGIFRNYDQSPHLAKFTIETAPGSNYFVKLSEARSNYPVMTFFVIGGRRITENVPLGNFVLKFATGKSWCGEDDLFGGDIGMSVADDKFLFDENSWWTVELVYQSGGNMRTHPISKRDF